MAKLRVLKCKDYVMSWNDVTDFEKDCDEVEIIEAETTEECERIATEKGYTADVYCWTSIGIE